MFVSAFELCDADCLISAVTAKVTRKKNVIFHELEFSFLVVVKIGSLF